MNYRSLWFIHAVADHEGQIRLNVELGHTLKVFRYYLPSECYFLRVLQHLKQHARQQMIGLGTRACGGWYIHITTEHLP